MALAAPDLLSRVIAPLALRRIALDGLGIEDHQRRAGLAPGFLAVGHDEMVVDALDVPAVSQKPPVVIADAVRREILGQGVPGDAIALDIADAVHDLAKHMHARPPKSLCHGQEWLQNAPFRIREITGISLAATIVARPIFIRPDHDRLIHPLTRRCSITSCARLYSPGAFPTDSKILTSGGSLVVNLASVFALWRWFER